VLFCIILDKSTPFYIHKGDRIAQGVIAAVQTMNKTKFVKTDSLYELTKRFGWIWFNRGKMIEEFKDQIKAYKAITPDVLDRY